MWDAIHYANINHSTACHIYLDHGYVVILLLCRNRKIFSFIWLCLYELIFDNNKVASFSHGCPRDVCLVAN
jgi:hypothetical protein